MVNVQPSVVNLWATGATFNFEGQKMYCAKHKLEGMINVKVEQCDHPGCFI